MKSRLSCLGGKGPFFTQLKMSGKVEKYKGEKREMSCKRRGGRGGWHLYPIAPRRCGTFHAVTMASSETRRSLLQGCYLRRKGMQRRVCGKVCDSGFSMKRVLKSSAKKR